MLVQPTFVTLVTLLSAVSALKSPSYNGFIGKWRDHFDLKADTQPDTTKWNTLATSNVFNNEWQTYTKNKANIRHTGESLQIIPQKDSKGKWTSGRIESKYTFTPTPGKITRLESKLRIGGSPKNKKKGIWPAFWLMGQSYRNGVQWPASGEIDIFENVNGDGIAVGVVHCDKAPGGVCNEPIGIANRVKIGEKAFDYHTWRVDFDLRKGTWKDQSITWYQDGVQYHKITGAQINNQAVWKTLAGQPLYIIFNVAVGGDFPGAPNSSTAGGVGNRMEIGYVSHYVSR